MKTKYIITILIVAFLLGSCVKKEYSIISPSFKPALNVVITELIDSLKNEIGENKLLSIRFHYPNSHTSYRNRQGCEMQIFILDGYSSSDINGYTKMDNATIAIYNLKDDIFELVNKNEITFFTDTILGFNDICALNLTGKDQIFYKITSEDSITRTLFHMDFSYLEPLRQPKCQGGITYTPPESFWFHQDSIRAEENFKYYQKEVEYYRQKISD